MDNEINNEVTIVSLDKMIYHAIYEIRYRLSIRPDEKRIFQSRFKSRLFRLHVFFAVFSK